MRTRVFKGALPPKRVLSFDPGFAVLGYAVADRTVVGGEVFIAPVALGIVKTEKEQGSKARADENRRVEELATAVRLLADRWEPAEFATEEFSPPRSASVAAKMAMVWTVLRCESLYRGLPFYQVSPMGLKLAVAGNRKASKDEVQAALARRYGGDLLEALARAGGIRWGDREHPMDALAVVTALFP